jgi:hypothetical protein
MKLKDYETCPKRIFGGLANNTLYKRRMIKSVFAITLIFALGGCATIVNDSHIPLAVSFSDGSNGQCTFKNKRGTWISEIPTAGVLIRRSDDDLFYDCVTEHGMASSGAIRSEMEGEKLAASVVFIDFGITDAITDMHRTYQGNIVLPVMTKEAAAQLAAARDEAARKAAAEQAAAQEDQYQY